jgi:hypothetical protein
VSNKRPFLLIFSVAYALSIGSGAFACEYVDPAEDTDGYFAWCRCMGGTSYTGSDGNPGCVPPPPAPREGGGQGGGPPPGGVDCGNNRYCNAGSYCGRDGQSCIPNDRVDCGSYSCNSGNYCGKAGGCIPSGKVDCDSYICDTGNNCGRGGSYCVPYDKIDCGGFVCPSEDECGLGHTCRPKGTAERGACLDRNDEQLRALDSDMKLLTYHIGNATDTSSDVQQELEGWISKNEQARQEAVSAAIESLNDVAEQTLFLFAHWHRPPPNAGRLEANVTNFLRASGIAYRKLEMENPRFLKYATATIKGVKAEHKLANAQSWRDYIHAIGSLTEALIDLAGPLGKSLSYPKRLIAIGKADVDIWSADFYAYWVAVMTAYHSKHDAEIRDSELRDMAMWSQMLEADTRQKRDLEADRDLCPAAGGN